MSRTPRPYAPGAVFHITSRTIRHVHWFSDPIIADGIVRILRESLIRSDAQLLAWAVMPNHYHLIVRQGSAPLARLMRRLNQRIAHLVQNYFDHQGYVFERRFRHVECKEANHLRNAIVYVHRNPVDGGLCVDPATYRWSSHRSYFPDVNSRSADSLIEQQPGADPQPDTHPQHPQPDTQPQHPQSGTHPQSSADPEPGATPDARRMLALPPIIPALRLFAAVDDESVHSLRAGYLAYSTYVDAYRTAVPPDVPRPPLLEAGDRYWIAEFVGRPARTLNNSRNWRPDLADLARNVIQEMAPGFTIDQMVMRRGGRAVSAIRHEIIRRAARMGFRGVDIANYLHISTASVAYVATAEVGRPRQRDLRA